MRKTLKKVAIVTGGASGSGATEIGKTVSLKLLKEGHHVVVCDKNLNAAKSIIPNNSETDEEMFPKFLDVTKPKMVTSLFKEIFHKYGRIDILVNSAGPTTHPTPLVLLSNSDFKKVIDVHLMGTFYCMREAATYMIKGNYGRIINISSRAGVYGLYGESNYSAAKAGIIGLSFAAAKELYEKGITVNVIAPGPIRPPKSNEPINKRKRGHARLDLITGEPIDVANLVAFLIKEESYLINGSVFILDAGGHLWHGMDEKFSKIIKSTVN